MRAGRLLAMAGVLAITWPAIGQWGLHVVIPQFEKVFDDAVSDYDESFTPTVFDIGFGYDRDLTSHTAIGIDLLFRVNALDPDQYFEVIEDDLSYSYSLTSSVTTLKYRSVFFFSGNKEASMYLGSELGLRLVKRSLKLVDVYNYGSSADPDLETKVERSKVVVPIAIRLGARGDLRAFFADVHVFMGYQIGGGEMFDEPYLQDLKLAGLIYGVGLALGGGREADK